MSETTAKPFFRPGNRLFWIAVAIIIRVCILAFFLQSAKALFPERIMCGFAIQQNDYEYFLGPVDQYFETGIFQYENSPGKAFAGRMPGYSFIYLLLRHLFEKNTALTILFSLQVLLSAYCVYLLARISEKLFHQRTVFYIVFFLSAISIHTSLFDIFTLAESFSVSAIILFLYFGIRYFENRKTSDLILTGLFVAWAVFLRPFLGLFLAIFPLLIYFYRRKSYSFTRIITHAFIFALPFMVFESLWIWRNYRELGRFIPLETSLSESYGERGAYRTSAISIRALINAWGGETGEFYDGSEAAWFHFAEGDEIENYNFPGHAFHSSFNRDSLVALKKIFNASVDTSFSESEKDSLNMLASSIALRYAAQYKNDNLIRYYVINPVARAGRLVFANGTRLLPLPGFDQMNIIQKMVKLFYFGLYMLVTIAGLTGMVMIFAMRTPVTPQLLWCWLVPPVLVFTLVAFSDILEFRYFIGAYPVFILFSAYLVVMTINKIKGKKHNIINPAASPLA